MGTIANGVRFIVGAAMVAAGVTLAAPLGLFVVESVAAARQAPQPTTTAALPPSAGVPVMPPTPAVPPQATPAWPPAEQVATTPVALRADYAPPSPPARLPPVAPALQAEGPAMTATYRSTFDVPPPPLLDAQAAPPLVAAWAAPKAAGRTVEAPQADLVPATYVVRDGDDLTGISTRFYGHPGGAAAVWEANRDVIPDPNLLPIGAELRLPPAWTVGGPHSHASAGAVRSIDPPHAPAAMPPPGAAPAAPHVWLGSHAAQQSSGAMVPSAPVSGGSVRLAPGETLESIAVRFYGDRAAAQRIWEANRDRLRSPELAVAGMELRLP
ncbi:MAG: LysM peptidoglycan-binding domain-containing protein [Pirellulales bacterium]